MSGAHWNSNAGGESSQPQPQQPDSGWPHAHAAAATAPASSMHAHAASHMQVQAVAASSRKRKGSAQQTQQPQPSHGHFTAAASESPAAPASASSTALADGDGDGDGAVYSTCQLTLGLEVSGQIMHPIIPRGTRLPCTSTQLFSTYADQQQYGACRPAGRLDLFGIRPAPRGVPRIEVTFSLDAFGTLRVAAQESLYGSVQALTVQSQFQPNSPALSWGRLVVADMLASAELHRAEDERLMACMAAKSRLEQYCYGLSTSLEQQHTRTLLTADEARLIQRQHEACVRWLAAHAQDAPQLSQEEFERKLEEIQAVCQPIVIKLYESTSAQAPAITSSPSDTQFATVQSGHRNSNSGGGSGGGSGSSSGHDHTNGAVHFASPPAVAEHKSPDDCDAAALAPSFAAGSTVDTGAAAAALSEPSGSGLLASSSPPLARFGNGQLLPPLEHGEVPTTPPIHSGTHASPDSYPYQYSGSARLPSFSATSSSPLLSSLAPPVGWTHPWTHPSLLTSPILSSTYHHADYVTGANGTQLQPNGAGAGGQASGSATSVHANGNGHGHANLPNLDDSCMDVMDFLTFPNSATLSLTTVNLTDDATPSVSSRAADTEMHHLPVGVLDHEFGTLHAAPSLPHEMRLRGGSIERRDDTHKRGAGGQRDADDAEISE